MLLDPDSCYRALCARDDRFDGVFFVGVTTTGVYCRPICPARTPGRPRCVFFGRPAEAERAGFRACFRCRPELSPGRAMVDAIPQIVRAAAARIDAGYLNDHSVDDLAGTLGVTARHLRRAMEAKLGASPVELAQTRRLALAKQLLHDTTLPLTDVAHAAGFASVRRFNALFSARFGRPPSSVRRAHGDALDDGVALRLDYRPPLDWDALLAFLAARAIPGVEEVADGEYRRTVRLAGRTGWIAVRHAADRPAVVARVSARLAPALMDVAARLRALFDLDAQPREIAGHLGADPLLAPLVARRPGLRVPGSFSRFELAVRAVIGQQVSVAGARTLLGRIAHAFGAPADAPWPALDRAFPGAEDLSTPGLDDVRSIGVPRTRAATLRFLARAVADGRVDLSGATTPAPVIERLQALPGIGPWTAQYIAMRALRWPDAFPAGDLAVRRRLGVTTDRSAEERARAWSPWRAYGVMHVWSSLAHGG